LLILIFSAETSLAIDREGYFREAHSHLAFYLFSLSDHFISTLSDDEQRMLNGLRRIAVDNIAGLEYLERIKLLWGNRYSFELEFSDNSEDFKLTPQEPSRTAFTTEYENGDIYVNRQLINSQNLEFSYLDVIQILIHEFGHKVRYKNQAAVDSLAAKIKRELEQYTLSYRLTDDTIIEGLFIADNILYQDRELPIDIARRSHFELALTNKELVLFENKQGTITALQNEFYNHLKSYRGLHGLTHLQWTSYLDNHESTVSSIRLSSLEISPLSTDKKLIVKLSYAIFDNTLFPYRDPKISIDRLNSEMDNKQEYLKQNKLTTQITFSPNDSKSDLSFKTNTLIPIDENNVISVLKSGYKNAKEFEVVIQTPNFKFQKLQLLLQTDKGAEVKLIGRSNLDDTTSFIYSIPKSINSESLYFDRLLVDEHKLVFTNEGYKLKRPHFESNDSGLLILDRNLDLVSIDNNKVQINVRLTIQSKSPLLSLNWKWKSVIEVINPIYAQMGERKRSSLYQIKENNISFDKKQIRQTKTNQGWIVEFSYIDTVEPALPVKNEFVQPDADGPIYHLYPISKEDTGDRWVNEIELINEQLSVHTEKDDILIKYNTKNASSIKCSDVIWGQ
jgi:hypothetical protein